MIAGNFSDVHLKQSMQYTQGTQDIGYNASEVNLIDLPSLCLGDPFP